MYSGVTTMKLSAAAITAATAPCAGGAGRGGGEHCVRARGGGAALAAAQRALIPVHPNPGNLGRNTEESHRVVQRLSVVQHGYAAVCDSSMQPSQPRRAPGRTGVHARVGAGRQVEVRRRKLAVALERAALAEHRDRVEHCQLMRHLLCPALARWRRWWPPVRCRRRCAGLRLRESGGGSPRRLASPSASRPPRRRASERGRRPGCLRQRSCGRGPRSHRAGAAASGLRGVGGGGRAARADDRRQLTGTRRLLLGRTDHGGATSFAEPMKSTVFRTRGGMLAECGGHTHSRSVQAAADSLAGGNLTARWRTLRLVVVAMHCIDCHSVIVIY
eukprot:SAG11_NODE_3258_length_2574_cov_4.255354_1_plen_331_part_00